MSNLPDIFNEIFKSHGIAPGEGVIDKMVAQAEELKVTAKPDGGGPAFPSHGTMGEVVCEGMSLRDYFAAKAIQAL
jgi:hypothetical protein